MYTYGIIEVWGDWMDWKRKLTSRKFWMALAGFITSILVVFAADEGTITKVVGVITSASVVCAYLFAEAKTDAEGGRNDE